MDIRCRKTQCKYNDRHTCRAREIEINERDLCLKYEPECKSEEEVGDTSKKLFTKTPDYAPQRDTKRMKISCKNSCVLNKEGRCIANGITINDIHEIPLCMTFVKK